jgi:hypothetical protein
LIVGGWWWLCQGANSLWVLTGWVGITVANQ